MSEHIDILLVDDEPRNLDVLDAILVHPSYRLLHARDADGALRLLLDHDVAAIVLDIKMPGTSGFELAQIIKSTKRFREIPILFLTAYLIEETDVLTGYGAGAVDYLTKPLNAEIVRHKVAVFADLFRKTRALADLNEKLEERVRGRTAELEKSELALRTADRRKDEFIAVLAHELRNPLAPLRFGLDLLSRMDTTNGSAVTKTLTVMNRQLDHMVRLIDDLLDISRVSRGAIELKKEQVDLATVIETAVELTKPAIVRRHHSLSLHIAPGVFARADPTRLAQIIGNLLNNAAKFTADHGRISVELVATAEHAVVQVIDSGEGIAADQLERVFEMFARVGISGTKSEPGLGIGLALARRLAEMHGATLTAASEGVGRGTTFTLRLPMLRADEQQVQIQEEKPSQARTALSLVVVEDSEDNATTLVAWLENMGHRVAAAQSGGAGVTLVFEAKPDLVLCDLGLPDIDGLEVCRRIRALPLAQQPVMVALTGWGRDDDRRRTREAGFDDHLVKPVSVERLELLLSVVGARKRS